MFQAINKQYIIKTQGGGGGTLIRPAFWEPLLRAIHGPSTSILVEDVHDHAPDNELLSTFETADVAQAQVISFFMPNEKADKEGERARQVRDALLRVFPNGLLDAMRAENAKVLDFVKARNARRAELNKAPHPSFAKAGLDEVTARKFISAGYAELSEAATLTDGDLMEKVGLTAAEALVVGTLIRPRPGK